ncbi:MAG: MFS transporter [Candidatus Micrarchaeota archaeon]
MGVRKNGGLSANTKILGAVSFLGDASSEMLEPIIPLFLTNVLGASALVIGLLEGVSEIAVAVMRFVSGWFSDEYRSRKKLVLFGYSLSTLMKGFFPFTATWPQFFALKTVERIGKGVRTPPRDAIIGESEPWSRLGRAFGFRKMMDSAGAILGPLLAAFLLAFFAGMGEEAVYRAIFMIAVIPAALGVALIFFVKESEKQLERIKDGKGLFNGEIRGFMLVAALFSLGQMGTAFFILRSSELLPLVMIPVAYLAYNAVYTTMAIPMGILTDRVGPKRMMVAAYSMFAASTLVFAFTHNELTSFVGFALLGVFIAIIETTPRVYLVETVPGHRYASAIGAYQGITGILLLPANIIAGALWNVQVLGAHAPFIFSAAVAAVSIALMQLYVKEARGNR